MRHADSGVTEGYSHARRDELHTAIERLPSPLPESATAEAVKTGTDDARANHPTTENADHQLDQTSFLLRQFLSLGDTAGISASQPCDAARRQYTLLSGNDLQQVALSGNSEMVHAGSVHETRPSTQVD
jgi:hypothetical protein